MGVLGHRAFFRSSDARRRVKESVIKEMKMATNNERQLDDAQAFGSVLKSFFKSRAFVYCRSVVFSAIMYFVAYYLSFAIKTDGFELTGFSRPGLKNLLLFWHSVGWVLAIKLLVVFVRRTYRNLGFYATMRDLRFIIVDAVLSFACILIWFTIGNKAGFFKIEVPFSILFLDMIFSVIIRGGVRLFRRFVKESVLPRLDPDSDEEPAFLVGANTAGAHIANTINTQHNVGYHVVGFLTIHHYKVKMSVATVPVVAHVDDLVEAASRYGVNTILFVAGSLPGKLFREIYNRCDKHGLKLQVVPQVEFLPDKKIPIREIDINDLLKRDPINLDTKKISALVEGRRIMVTGAGGSIGSESCRQLMRFNPKELILLGRGENRIFFLERELRALGSPTVLTPVIADVSNAPRIDSIFSSLRPQIVFHAAAHKHVPLMEANIPEAIRNNIYGTKVVADASDRYGVEKFVMISTDKAVNPTSVMGCSKQMAERYVNARGVGSKTKFIVTRFGNVLGSNGSVVPIFTKQIQNGGPITITDLRMTRYFMTIPEASQLVLEAASMGEGGEIFVLDMGEPVKIVELAKDMIRLAGLPENAIEIKEIGLRPGEKLYEELYFESEERIETNQPKLFAAKHREFKLAEVQAQLDELLQLTSGPQEKIRERLQDFVPEYKPTIIQPNQAKKA